MLPSNGSSGCNISMYCIFPISLGVLICFLQVALHQIHNCERVFRFFTPACVVVVISVIPLLLSCELLRDTILNAGLFHVRGSNLRVAEVVEMLLCSGGLTAVFRLNEVCVDVRKRSHFFGLCYFLGAQNKQVLLLIMCIFKTNIKASWNDDCLTYFSARRGRPFPNKNRL